MRWPAPAKLNLFLHVLGRRSDGYHELQTLFQILDWGDELEIEADSSGEIRRVFANYDVAEEQDLVTRAARLLQRECGVRLGARIGVFKNIPAGAGLGGGSSDAATVLVALNRLWGCRLAIEDLAALGLQLGADVPVFVHGHSAMAGGVGENLYPVELGERYYVLVFPRRHLSTQEVFSAPGLKRDSQAIELPAALRGEGRNDCEAVVRQRCPDIDRLMTELAPWGRPRLTGTGSAVFLSYGEEALAMSTAQKLKSHYNVRAVSGVDRSPLRDYLETVIDG